MTDYKYVNDMIEEIEDRSSKATVVTFTGNMMLNDNWPINESMFNDSDYLIVDELSQNEHFGHYHRYQKQQQQQQQQQQQYFNHNNNNVFGSKLNEFATNLNEPSDILWLISYNVARIIDKIGQESIDNHCGNKVEKYKRKKYKQTKFEPNSSAVANAAGPVSSTSAKSVAKKSNLHSKNANNPKSKPPFTYTELIEHALIDRGELTVSGIYKWISEHYPYYDMNDDRWKNSVRHNLSISSSFRKGGKTGSGAGHLWTTIAVTNSNRANSLNETKENVLSTKKSKNHIKREYRSKEKKINQKPASVEYTKLVKHEQVSLDYFSGDDDDCFAPPSNDNELIEEVVTGFAPDDPLFANELMIDDTSNFHDNELSFTTAGTVSYHDATVRARTVELDNIEHCPMNFNDENIFDN